MHTRLRYVAKRIIVACLYHGPPIPQKVNGKTLWLHPRALFSVSAKTFFKGEAHVRRWLEESLQPGDVFFDVGAHHGLVSLRAAALVGNDGAVCSFEPSPANLSILNWHQEKNPFARWIIVPKAVCDEDSTERTFILIDDGDSPMNSLTTGADGMPLMEGRIINKLTVQTVSLDTFYLENQVRPKVLKIDVEGAELLVLRGAERLLSEVQPVIMLAVHPYWLPAGQTTTQLMEFLTTLGYRALDSKGRPARSFASGEYLCIRDA